MEFVDTHCHLHFKDYFTDPDQVVANAKKIGVTKLVNVGTNLEDSKKAIDFAKNIDGVWATAGVHPHDATNFLVQKDSPKILEKLLDQLKVVAVGEIGLDYYRSRTSKEDQEKVLRAQIEIGLKMNLPFVFHVRDAWPDFWKIIDDYKGIAGVAHSFNSDVTDLDKVLSRGLYVALNGIMTFTKNESQLGAARAVPLNKLVIETDAPFLSPKPFRGEICEPKHVAVVAEFLAKLRGEDLQELAQATTKNAINLFELDMKQ
jgi:TatD DNase family protein